MSNPGATTKPLALLLGAACLGPWVDRPAPAQPGPPYRINGQLAPQVQANPVASQLQAQLRNLKSDLERRARSTDLQGAIETALLNNPDLAAAYAKIQNSQWSLIAVRRQWYPNLDARSTGLPLQTFKTTNGRHQGIITENATSTTVGATLSWTFFDPSRGPTINASSESLRRQQLLFDVSARNLVLAVQQTYFQLQEQRQLVIAYDEILVNTDRQVQLTEAKFNSGLVGIAEVDQIRAQQYSTLSELITIYRQLLDTAAQLAQTMALPPGTLVLPADQLRRIGNWNEPLATTIDQALRLREEIQASLAAAASASWNASSLFNRYWPTFSLGANGSVTNADRTVAVSGLAGTNTSTLNWDGTVGLGFSWRLFDGGINAANAQASLALAKQAQEQAAIDRLTVTSQVEQSYSAYLTSQLSLQSANAQIQAARRAVIAVEERFKVGVDNITTVVQTLGQAIRAANAYASALRGYNTAVASLYRYSARWPEGTETPLQARTNMLKQQ